MSLLSTPPVMCERHKRGFAWETVNHSNMNGYMRRPARILVSVLVAFILAIVQAHAPAWAWGAKGHHLINRLAVESLPADFPGFMRTRRAIDELTDLGLELDLLKGSGTEWDGAKDPGHYIDLVGDGTLEGGLRLNALPVTREAYDTALRKTGYDQYKAGFVPYSIVQGWEQLRMGFAYWRVDRYEMQHAKTRVLRATAADRAAVDESLILRDAGVWGHYVADASQPLHVTVHFNGWGHYPNPHGYSNSAHLHDLFETDFVNRYVTATAVAKHMTSLKGQPSGKLLDDQTILSAVERYLAESNATVPELYQIEKTGGFENGTPRAVAFVSERLAFGASELRTLIVWAWADSLNETIGDDAPQQVRNIVQGGALYKGL